MSSLILQEFRSFQESFISLYILATTAKYVFMDVHMQFCELRMHVLLVN